MFSGLGCQVQVEASICKEFKTSDRRWKSPIREFSGGVSRM